jgi:DNA-binding NarL/FixJ family response regulator
MASGSLPKVLIVDDNEDVRDVLRLTFELDGFDVVGEAENGLVALGLAMDSQPDFVILDSQMPVEGGGRAAAQLRTIVPDARIVAFSGTIDRKPAWADYFLSKTQLGELSPLLQSLVA